VEPFTQNQVLAIGIFTIAGWIVTLAIIYWICKMTIRNGVKEGMLLAFAERDRLSAGRSRAGAAGQALGSVR